MKTKTDAMKTLINAGWDYEDIISVLGVAGNIEDKRIAALPAIKSECMPSQQPLDFNRGRTLWYKADEAIAKLTTSSDIAMQVGAETLKTDAFQSDDLLGVAEEIGRRFDSFPRFKVVSADLRVGDTEPPETDAFDDSNYGDF